jgi:peptidoglycan/xylan/chitin deacetylase (PgdA/CDA1 family)
MQNRRSFLIKAGAGAITLPYLSFCSGFEKSISHVVSISFDDGFEKSFLKTAGIYEKYKLNACFNVIASGHDKDFKPPDDYIQPSVIGDFDLWNELKGRGHEIMPHGYKHENLARIDLADAQKLILKSLDVFAENLIGFEPLKAIFNFPFNSSSKELEEWLKDKVLAFRTAGSAINKLPHKKQQKLTCISAGPDNIDSYFEEQIQKFLSGPKGWFIFNAHGLDGEGWGPMSSGYLDELLDRLLDKEHVGIMPVGKALLSL